MLTELQLKLTEVTPDWSKEKKDKAEFDQMISELVAKYFLEMKDLFDSREGNLFGGTAFQWGEVLTEMLNKETKRSVFQDKRPGRKDRGNFPVFNSLHLLLGKHEFWISKQGSIIYVCVIADFNMPTV